MLQAVLLHSVYTHFVVPVQVTDFTLKLNALLGSEFQLWAQRRLQLSTRQLDAAQSLAQLTHLHGDS